MSQRGLVILDRDGVINEDSPDPVRSPQQWRPIPGSPGALERLTGAGITLAVATNQSGLARGLFDRPALEAIHDRMLREIRAAGGDLACIRLCPHGPGDGCACRKPAPGLLVDIGRSLGVSLAGVPFVGDAERDLAAARTAGCAPVLVRTGRGRATERSAGARGVRVFDDLAAFADACVGPRRAALP